MTRPRTAVLLLAGLLASCTAGAAPQQPSVSYGAGEGAAAKLATDLCVACHGENLAGGRSSSLIDDTWAFGGTDADLAQSIRDGRPNTLMQPFDRRSLKRWRQRRLHPRQKCVEHDRLLALPPTIESGCAHACLPGQFLRRY